MNNTPDEKILELQAQLMLQGAEIAGVFAALDSFVQIVKPGAASLEESVVKSRNRIVEARLLALERSDPAFAAKLQSVFDEARLHLTYDHDAD